MRETNEERAREIVGRHEDPRYKVFLIADVARALIAARREGFEAGEADMRERAANEADFCYEHALAEQIRTLPPRGETGETT